jgi:hypothetical protein
MRTKRFKTNEIYFQTLKRGPRQVLRARRIAAKSGCSVKSALHFGFVNSLIALQMVQGRVVRTLEDR